MTEKRWKVANHLIQSKDWDFFMMVEMGTDRIHHGFWSHMDPEHFRYEPGNAFEHAIHDYYVYIDGQIGKLLENVGDETMIMVVSDHGIQRMDGGFCVNEWLQRQGYLTLSAKPPGVVELSQCQIDWGATQAWSSGGYYARVFMNVQGREPQGTIPAGEYEAARDRLKRDLEAVAGPDGRPLGNIVLKPQDIYREVTGIAPDLIVYFGALYWRSVGKVGYPDVFTYDNDTGPDDANHAQYGMLITYDPQAPRNGAHLEGLQLEAIGPTLLDWLGVDAPDSMMARPIVDVEPVPLAHAAEGATLLTVMGQDHEGDGSNKANGTTDGAAAAAGADGYTEEEAASMSDHLAALGYL
jgi:predicted AlkP superfamily phosphohydrolase/phosphomutase